MEHTRCELIVQGALEVGHQMCLRMPNRAEYLGVGRWSSVGARGFLLSVECVKEKEAEVLTSAVDSVDNRLPGADPGILAVQS